MSASHDSTGQSSGTAIPAATAQQLSALGSSDPNWLTELQNLGYTPNSGSWPTGVGTAVGTSNVANAPVTPGGGAVGTPVQQAQGLISGGMGPFYNIPAGTPLLQQLKNGGSK